MFKPEPTTPTRQNPSSGSGTGTGSGTGHGTGQCLTRRAGAMLWKQIHDILRQEIRAGIFTPGERFPTEAELTRRFEVNRHTVRRALSSLREADLIRSEQGKGVFVTGTLLEYQVARRTRFTANMRVNNTGARSHFLFGDILPATEAVARQLKIRAGARVTYIEMYGEAEGARLFVNSGYFPYDGLEGLMETFRRLGSLTKSMAELGVRDFVRAESRVTTRLPDVAEAKCLGIDKKQPLLVIDYVNTDLRGKPVEYGISRFAGDKLQLIIPNTSELTTL